MKLFVNLFCRDVDAQFAFYQALLGLPEHAVSRSPIYRALHTDGFQFGFHAQPAYTLLGLEARRPQQAASPVTGYATLMLHTPEAVSTTTARVAGLGGTVVKGPYPTYYGQWQAVLCDPEHNVFRLSVEGLPAGVEKPALVLPSA